MNKEEMEIANIEELPSNWLTPEEIKKFNDSHRKLVEIMIRENKIKLLDDMKFKYFWLLCETPKPLVYRDFKYRNRYLITRDKTKLNGGEINMKNEEMEFVDSSELPQKKGGRTGTDWETVFKAIPKGKMWIPKKANVQSLREAVTLLETAKKIKTGEYTVTQRTVDKITKIYVIHNKTVKEKKVDESTKQPEQPENPATQ